MDHYQPFIVRVEPQGADAYRITAECQGGSWSGTVASVLPLLTPGEIAQAEGWLARGFVEREYVRDFGNRLFRTLFAGDVLAGFRAASTWLGREVGLRVVLELPSRLAQLPWELMYDAEGDHGFLARSVTAPLVRRLAGMPLPNQPPAEGPLRILFVAASPQDYPPLSSAQEAEAVRRHAEARRLPWRELPALVVRHIARNRSVRGLSRRLASRRLIEMEVLEHATPSALAQRIADARRGGCPYHVVHLASHAGAVEGEGCVLLEREDGRGEWVTAEAFAELVADPALNLVVLNACGTGDLGLFNSVAQAVLRRGVPAVVAMQVPVLDRAGVEFSREFYGTWAAGDPLEVALARARRAMTTEAPAAAADWGAPVLFMGPSEGLTLPAFGPAPRLSPLVVVPAIVLMLALAVAGVLLLRAPTQMAGDFNVAVAEFGHPVSTGGAQSTELERALSRSVFESLRDTVPKEISGMQVWHDSLGPFVKRARLGVVSGETPEARRIAARALAERVGADLIIFGGLVQDANGEGFALRFYAPELADSEELIDEEQFGKPVPVLNLERPELGLSDPLKARVQALSLFTAGLNHELHANASLAAAYFEKADAVENWTAGDGKEVLAYFIGREALAAGRFVDASAAFSESISLNANYARPYIGLGNVLLRRAEALPATEMAEKIELLDQAIGWHEKAIAVAPASPGTAVPTKARLALSAAYLDKAGAYRAGEQYPEADVSLDQAIEAAQLALASMDVQPPAQDQAQQLAALTDYHLATAWHQKAFLWCQFEQLAQASEFYDIALDHFRKCGEHALAQQQQVAASIFIRDLLSDCSSYAACTQACLVKLEGGQDACQSDECRNQCPAQTGQGN